MMVSALIRINIFLCQLYKSLCGREIFNRDYVVGREGHI